MKLDVDYSSNSILNLLSPIQTIRHSLACTLSKVSIRQLLPPLPSSIVNGHACHEKVPCWKVAVYVTNFLLMMLLELEQNMSLWVFKFISPNIFHERTSAHQWWPCWLPVPLIFKLDRILHSYSWSFIAKVSLISVRLFVIPKCLKQWKGVSEEDLLEKENIEGF